MPTTKLSDMDMSKVTLENLGAQFCSDWLKDQIREMLTEIAESRAKLARVDGLVKALEFYGGMWSENPETSELPQYALMIDQGRLARQVLKDFGAGQ